MIRWVLFARPGSTVAHLGGITRSTFRGEGENRTADVECGRDIEFTYRATGDGHPYVPVSRHDEYTICKVCTARLRRHIDQMVDLLAEVQEHTP